MAQLAEVAGLHWPSIWHIFTSAVSKQPGVFGGHIMQRSPHFLPAQGSYLPASLAAVPLPVSASEAVLVTGAGAGAVGISAGGGSVVAVGVGAGAGAIAAGAGAGSSGGLDSMTQPAMSVQAPSRPSVEAIMNRACFMRRVLESSPSGGKRKNQSASRTCFILLRAMT